MHVIPADQHAFAFRPDATPVQWVQPGDIVRFETSSEPVERLFAAGDDWPAALDVRAINAVTGPVFIEGVSPGDAVAVEILDVQPADWCWNAFIPDFGLLRDHVPAPVLRRFPIRDGRIIVSDRLTLPVQPMIGCLGLAPAEGESSTLRPPYPWGGNYDLRQVAPGNTILFPAQIPGGLFSLGDLHAAMGDGEPTSVAIECAGSATVRLSVRPGLTLATPRIETPDRLYVIGLDANRDYHAARAQAANLLLTYLIAERGIPPHDAYTLISAAADLTFGGPAAAVVLASIPFALLDTAA